MRCSQCGAEIQANLRVCPVCAATVRRSWTFSLSLVRCRSCQGRVRPGVRICPHCGESLRHNWWKTLQSIVWAAVLILSIYALVNYAPWSRAVALWSEIRLPRWSFLATPTARPRPTFHFGQTPTEVPLETEEQDERSTPTLAK